MTRIEKILTDYPDSIQAKELSELLFRASESVKFITVQQLEIKENLFPGLLKFRRLYGPTSILSDCEIWEFALSENDFFQYAETQDPKHLDNLISKIYRPRRFFRKQRKSFDEDKVKKQIRRISKLPIAVKWLIFRWLHTKEKFYRKSLSACF